MLVGLLVVGATEEGATEAIGALDVGIVDGFTDALTVGAVVGSFVRSADGFIVVVSLTVVTIVGFIVSLKDGILDVVLCGVAPEVGFKVVDGFDVSIADGFDVAEDGFSVLDSTVIFEVGFPVADEADGLEDTAAVAIKEGDTELDAA